MDNNLTVSEELAALHGYLCADGYLSISQVPRRVRYVAALRNTEIVLLNDFNSKFKAVFGVFPKISKQIDLSKLCNKRICLLLKKEFGSFHCREWSFPDYVFTTKNFKASWLRAVFDCEGWAVCKKGIDRHIGIEMANPEGIQKIKSLLAEFGIVAGFKIKKRGKIFRLNIFGKENLQKFSNQIGFLHPKKRVALQAALDSYVVYNWEFPEEEAALKEFIFQKLNGKSRDIFSKLSSSPKRVRICSCVRANLLTMHGKLKTVFGIDSNVSRECLNSIGTVYFELSINKKEAMAKLQKLAQAHMSTTTVAL